MSLSWLIVIALGLFVAVRAFLRRGRITAFNAKSKVVVITGATAGIGEELAYQYAKQGRCKLVISGRRTDKLKEVEDKCKQLGAEAVLSIPCDVSVDEQCKALIDKADAWSGGFDVLILNAGILASFYFTAADHPSVGKPVLDTNVYGCIYPCFYALKTPTFIQRKGRIVVVSSVAGHVPYPRVAYYHASKHALEGFFNSVRMEISAQGVSVTMINPGVIETDMGRGKSLSKDGSIAPPGSSHLFVPTYPLDACVARTIESIAARDFRLVLPWWYWVPIWLYRLLPEVYCRLSQSPRPSSKRQASDQSSKGAGAAATVAEADNKSD